MSRKCFWDRDWDAPVSGYIGHFFPCSYIIKVARLDLFFWGRAGGYLPSLSINYISKSKDMEKRLQQLYYIKMKISYDLGFITTESLWQRYDAITFFIYLCISLY